MNTTEAPPVTVLLASYNRLHYLQEAVASALAQTYPNFDVLVVDDGSSDETAAWLRFEASRHSNLRVSWQDHAGVGAARALGVLEAKGEIVLVLDSDDLIAPNTVEVVVDALEKPPRADLVYLDHVQLFPDGRRRRRRYPVFGSNRAMTWAIFISPKVPFKHTGTAYRRSQALAVGSYDPRLPCKIDIDFFLKFLRADCRLRLVREPLAVFRFHLDSVSRNRRAGIDAWFQLIDRYGPRSRIVRGALKLLRASYETLKWTYEVVFRETSSVGQ